jgi:hypothetical protein
VGDRVALFTGADLTTKTIVGSCSGTGYLAVSPNGEWVATATWRGKGTEVRRVKDGSLVCDWRDLGEAQLAFSPNSRWLVTGTTKEIKLWEVGS